jgi:hypothetical protein
MPPISTNKSIGNRGESGLMIQETQRHRENLSLLKRSYRIADSYQLLVLREGVLNTTNKYQ